MSRCDSERMVRQLTSQGFTDTQARLGLKHKGNVEDAANWILAQEAEKLMSSTQSKALPHGWKEMIDGNGRTYYTNAAKRQTTYTDPRLLAPKPQIKQPLKNQNSWDNAASGDSKHDNHEPKTPQHMEGFICPACWKQFPTVEQLMDHSASAHAQRFERPPSPPARNSGRLKPDPFVQQQKQKQKQQQRLVSGNDSDRFERGAEEVRWSQWQVLEDEREQAKKDDAETQQLQRLHGEALTVREIWGDLASLVADQSEKLDIVRGQATETSQKVQSGVHELAAAAKYRTKKYAWNTALGTGVVSGVGGAAAVVASGGTAIPVVIAIGAVSLLLGGGGGYWAGSKIKNLLRRRIDSHVEKFDAFADASTGGGASGGGDGGGSDDEDWDLGGATAGTGTGIVSVPSGALQSGAIVESIDQTFSLPRNGYLQVQVQLEPLQFASFELAVPGKAVFFWLSKRTRRDPAKEAKAKAQGGAWANAGLRMEPWAGMEAASEWQQPPLGSRAALALNAAAAAGGAGGENKAPKYGPCGRLAPASAGGGTGAGYGASGGHGQGHGDGGRGVRGLFGPCREKCTLTFSLQNPGSFLSRSARLMVKVIQPEEQAVDQANAQFKTLLDEVQDVIEECNEIGRQVNAHMLQQGAAARDMERQMHVADRGLKTANKVMESSKLSGVFGSWWGDKDKHKTTASSSASASGGGGERAGDVTRRKRARPHTLPDLIFEQYQQQGTEGDAVDAKGAQVAKLERAVKMNKHIADDFNREVTRQNELFGRLDDIAATTEVKIHDLNRKVRKYR